MLSLSIDKILNSLYIFNTYDGEFFEQNYWFVLVLNELDLYIKTLESESISK
ncbi:hypothetical protein QIA00_05005 (plasmid) [Borreliella americana]|uniref:Uncharacterized protein n=1 Tax=Borreliella americana TaxID=478807 RepID=A0ACD5G6G4_9SPIR